MVFLVVNLVILVLCALALWKPATCFGSAVAIYAFEQWAQVQDMYFAQHSSYINIAHGVIVLLGVLGATARTWNPFNPFPVVGYLIAGLFALATVSCLWSINYSLSLYLLQDAAPYIVVFVFLLPLTIQQTDDVRTAVVSALVMGTVVLVLLQFGTELHRWGRSIEVRGLETRSGELRSRATPLAPATLAGHVIVMLCLMNFRRIDRIWYILMWAILPLGFWICIRSGTRGQYFAAVMVIVGLFGPARGIKRMGGLAVGLMVAGAVVAFAWYFLAEFGSSGRWGLSNMIQNYSETRLGASQIILRYWLNSSPPRLLFGIGSSASFDPNVLDGFPHVLPVEILTQLGMVGLLLYLTILATTFFSMVRTFRAVIDKPEQRGMLVTLAGLFLFELLRSMKEWPMLHHVYLFGLAIMIGRFEMLVRRESAAERRQHYQEAMRKQMAMEEMQQREQQHEVGAGT